MGNFLTRLFAKKERTIEDMVLDEAHGASQKNAVATTKESKAPAPSVESGKPASADSKRITALIGAGVKFTGDIETKSSVHISGTVNGRIISGGAAVSVSAGGLVEGFVSAEHVLIGGTIKGEIRAKGVRLYASAVVEGDIFCENLRIDDGARLLGRSLRYDRPSPELVDGESLRVEGGASVVEMLRESSRAAAC